MLKHYLLGKDHHIVFFTNWKNRRTMWSLILNTYTNDVGEHLSRYVCVIATWVLTNCVCSNKKFSNKKSQHLRKRCPRVFWKFWVLKVITSAASSLDDGGGSDWNGQMSTLWIEKKLSKLSQSLKWANVDSWDWKKTLSGILVRPMLLTVK
jgi:hypothetical protein